MLMVNNTAEHSPCRGKISILAQSNRVYFGVGKIQNAGQRHVVLRSDLLTSIEKYNDGQLSGIDYDDRIGPVITKALTTQSQHSPPASFTETPASRTTFRHRDDLAH